MSYLRVVSVRTESYDFRSRNTCMDPENLVRGGPTLTMFFCCFLVVGRKDDQNTTDSGTSSAASETPFQWRFAGGPMMA